MTTLICGSVAYDFIMTYPGRFADSLLPDQLHNINVSFLVPTLRREFGGTAGNIAYNLRLLGDNAAVMATVGDDIGIYRQRIEQSGIDTTHLLPIPDSFTAQCFVTSDSEQNQINAFHPGAMSFAHQNHIKTMQQKPSLVLVGPDGRDGMLQHARDCAEAGIPLIFDPGQGMPMFDGAELRTFIEQATYVTVNDYEIELLCKRTDWSIEQIAAKVQALIITYGADGSKIYTDNRCLDIPPAKAAQVLDPTGCGDAYRAGLIHGLIHGLDWDTTGRLASLMGCIKIEYQGPQNHAPSIEYIHERFHQTFGYAL